MVSLSGHADNFPFPPKSILRSASRIEGYIPDHYGMVLGYGRRRAFWCEVEAQQFRRQNGSDEYGKWCTRRNARMAAPLSLVAVAGTLTQVYEKSKYFWKFVLVGGGGVVVLTRCTRCGEIGERTRGRSKDEEFSKITERLQRLRRKASNSSTANHRHERHYAIFL